MRSGATQLKVAHFGLWVIFIILVLQCQNQHCTDVFGELAIVLKAFTLQSKNMIQHEEGVCDKDAASGES